MRTFHISHFPIHNYVSFSIFQILTPESLKNDHWKLNENCKLVIEN